MAAAQLGAARRLDALVCGPAAEARLLAELGAGATVVRSARSSPPPLSSIQGMERADVADRQLEALLGRLDGIHEELRRTERSVGQQRRARAHHARAREPERGAPALAYAALGTRAPHIRRRRA